jgi:hypothetical protein
MGKDDRIFFFSQLFRPKVFDMDFPQKVFYGVFELPLLRNAQKRHKIFSQKEKKKKEGAYLPHLVAICQIYVGFNFLFLWRPLIEQHTKQPNGQRAKIAPVLVLGFGSGASLGLWALLAARARECPHPRGT